MSLDKLLKLSIGELFRKYPYTKDFFTDHLIPYEGHENYTINQLFENMDEEVIEDNAINPELFISGLVEYMELMSSYFASETEVENTVTIYPGSYKDGTKEHFSKILISKGEIISIVGPTGSGKSRLL
ncbi:MAG: ABC transporter ATP-binding protein, partial [Candidatus Izimaplasma sp.]|nr:ABC transporter ATP-binding protein [Candidatus Izimaplasma bacterium]